MAAPATIIGKCIRCLRMSRRRLETVSTIAGVCQQQKRHNTIIMERVFPVPPGKDGGLPNSQEMNELHKILRHVEIVRYPTEMQCILTDFVEGIGIRGDVVSVKRDFFHNELYPAGLAVYASPDNIQEFEEERKAQGIEKAETRLGVFARMTMKELNHMHLEIPMSDGAEWTLTKQHVRVAFRMQGVELDEDCIVLPEDPITTFQEVMLDVWINGLESVKVKATVVPVSEKFPPVK